MSTPSMRSLVEDVPAIDALIAEYGSPSRPALCASALRDYLGASASWSVSDNHVGGRCRPTDTAGASDPARAGAWDVACALNVAGRRRGGGR